MKLTWPLIAGLLVSPWVLDSCIDDNYDLSDIDTNVSMQVRDLVIPINLDAIKLKSVISLEEGDAGQVVNGQYAALLKGRISSSEVGVPEFVIPRPANEIKQISTPTRTIRSSLARQADELLLAASISPDDASVDISMQASHIDPAIQSIDTIGFESLIEITFSVEQLSHLIEGFTLENLELTVPAHCTISVSDGGQYDEQSGKISFPDPIISSGGSKKITLIMDELRADQAGVRLENHSLAYHSVCAASGQLSVYRSQLKPGVSDYELLGLHMIDYRYGVSFDDDISVRTFSGLVDYEYPDVHVAPILLDDLPDVLAQDGTRVEIENPQIYFAFNNPMAASGVNPVMDLILSPDPASGEVFTTSVTAYDRNNCFCLSPLKPDTYYVDNEVDYSQAMYQPFSNLGRVLTGERLPKQINVDLTTGVHQQVSHFQLGNVGSVEGDYTFFAPLSLMPGSEVIYADTINGWNDDDLDDITISHLKLSAEVVKDIPYAIELTVQPIDVNGAVMDHVKASATLGAATGQALPLYVDVTGEIKHLDGIILKAHVKADKAETLSPEMTLKVSRVRVTASGSYDTEL